MIQGPCVNFAFPDSEKYRLSKLQYVASHAIRPIPFDLNRCEPIQVITPTHANIHLNLS